MKNIIRGNKKSRILPGMILMISILMIEQLSFGSLYNNSLTQTEPERSQLYTLRLQQAPDSYYQDQAQQLEEEQRFPGQGRTLNDDFYIYTKNTIDLNSNAQRLIEENIRGPKEQAAILFFHKKPFVIDIITRMPVVYTTQGQPIMQNDKQQVLPTIDDTLLLIDLSSLSYESKAATIEVLEIYLRAIDEAKQVAAIEAYFDANKQNFYLYQTANAQLTEYLNNQAQQIRKKINEVKTANVSQKDQNFTYESQKLSNANHIMFNKSQVNKIIENNDFRTKIKNRTNAAELMQAAQLLIKQCFIGQQLHLKDKIYFESFNKKELKNIKIDYIFKDFPDFDKLIKIASDIAIKNKEAANRLFKHINQAVQTALYIAKKESNYYLTTDPFVTILYDRHKIVDAYCVDPLYGATENDINRNRMWTALATAGYGVAIAGAAATAYYYKDIPSQVGSTIYNNSKSLQALDKKGTKIVTDAQKKLLETGQYVFDAAGNFVPNIGQTIQNVDNAIADYLNPSYWTQTQQAWKNLNLQPGNFKVDPMIEQYQ